MFDFRSRHCMMAYALDILTYKTPQCKYSATLQSNQLDPISRDTRYESNCNQILHMVSWWVYLFRLMKYRDISPLWQTLQDLLCTNCNVYYIWYIQSYCSYKYILYYALCVYLGSVEEHSISSLWKKGSQIVWMCMYVHLHLIAKGHVYFMVTKAANMQ